MHTPHIILITADQMRACDMGFMGAPVHTPNLDELARRGAVLTNAFCVSPVCTPSRAALFTGRYPHSTGAWNIGVAMNEDELTLCDHIHPLGYRCVAHGKMHLRPECQPWEPGKPSREKPALPKHQIRHSLSAGGNGTEPTSDSTNTISLRTIGSENIWIG